ncbi:hypothetical protein [Nonomuraea insulae]|uniref:Uncharacterized protein n=1 Tax=Nonomuraea insulae TaxID=1616787 RepID=A0ABW1CQK5_9ACTN
MNTQLQRSRTLRHGRIATLALAAAAAGLMFAPVAQGVASASSAAPQADASYVSTGKLAIGCPDFVASACGSFWWDDEGKSDHDRAHDESDQHQDTRGHDESDRHDDKSDHRYDKWGRDKWGQHDDKWGRNESDQHHDKWGHDKWGQKKVVFGKFVYGNIDSHSHDKADKSDKWGHDESDQHHDKWGHDKYDHHRAWN